MREFERKAVFVPAEGRRLGRAVVHTEICCEPPRAESVSHVGRLYCAANTIPVRDGSTPESTGARFQASLWLGIAADLRRRATRT